jgi:hypothetical protein
MQVDTKLVNGQAAILKFTGDAEGHAVPRY